MASPKSPTPQDPATLKLATPKIAEESIRRPMSGKTILAIIFLRFLR